MDDEHHRADGPWPENADTILALGTPPGVVSPVLRREIQRISLVTLVLGAIALPFGVRYAWLGLPLLAATSLLGVVAGLANLVLLRQIRDPSVAGILGTGVVFLVLLVRSLHTGGFDDPTFGAFLLVPVLAALTADARAGWAFSGVVLLVTLVLYGLEQTGFAIADQVPPASRDLQSLIDRAAAVLASAALIGVAPWRVEARATAPEPDPDAEVTLLEANADLDNVDTDRDDDEDVSDTPTVKATPPGRLRILAVDDELGVLLWLQAELVEHEVRVTTNVNDAVTAFVDRTCDVLLCDLEMPTTSGVEVFGAVRALVPDRLDRIVFLTGDSEPLDASAFDGVGALTVLRKPLDADELRTAIREASAAR